MKLVLQFALLGILLIAQSCSYEWYTATDVNGKNFKYKGYKNNVVQEQHDVNFFFKYEYHPQVFLKYTSNIQTNYDSIDKDFNFQFDTASLTLPAEFAPFKAIFQVGLISAQIIYCKEDTSCQAPRGLTMIDKEGKRITPIERNIFVEELTEFKFVEPNPMQKRLEIKIAAYGGMDDLLMELTNNNATKKTDFETFIKGARLTFLEHFKSEI